MVWQWGGSGKLMSTDATIDTPKLLAQATRLHELVVGGAFDRLNLRRPDGERLDDLAAAIDAMTTTVFSRFANEPAYRGFDAATVRQRIEPAIAATASSPYDWTLWAGHHRGKWNGTQPDDQPWYDPTDGGLRQDVLLPAGPGVNLSVQIGDGWVPIGWCVKPEPDPVCGIESSVHVGFAFDLPETRTAGLVWFLPNEAFLETSTPLGDGRRCRTAASTNGGFGRWTIEPLP